ncbi:MAG: hypothetical protein C0503_08570 [Gemmatimonas sp.]|nr:hypothetical protein [Gemmatimonas sp.]
MRRFALIASILVLAAACDKQTQAPGASASEAFTDLSTSPTLLFSVFGPREAPKLAPIAVVTTDGLKPITLDDAGWRQLDSIYFAEGRKLPIYRNGASIGELEIVRGMWPADSAPLYEVPGCSRVVPQALARFADPASFEETVEFLASSSPLVQPTDTKPFPADADAQGRTLASAVAAATGIGAEDLNGLDFHARWLRTGVGANGRSLLASYIDPDAGDLGPGAGSTAVLVLLAEDSAGTFNTSYQHARVGEARSVDFRRVINYADLDGDGKTEILMEQWRYAAIPSLVLLKHNGVRWADAFSVSAEWCTDKSR